MQESVNVWSNSSRCRQESVYLTPTWCLYYIIIALNIIITLRFSINCSTVICSPTILFAILREASSETYGPHVYFPAYKFPICNFSFLFTFFAIFYFPFHKPKTQKYLLYLLFSFIYLYRISPLQVTVKGLTTPFITLGASVWLFVQVFGDFCIVSYWFDTLVLKLRGNTYLYFVASPFPLQGKNQRKLKK